MKKAIPFLRFSPLILFIATLFLVPSCTKKEIENPACLAIFVPDYFQFTIVDKNTGADLFFSSTPSYTVDQIYFTVEGNTGKPKPKVETSVTLGKHFSIPGNGGRTGTIKVYVADELKFTIDYTMKRENNTNCSRDIFDKLTINSNQKEENIQGRVVKLKL